jgi:hypothetical protein
LEGEHDFLILFFHVVVAEQVQQAMHEEEAELPLLGIAIILGLTLGLGQTNQDFAEHSLNFRIFDLIAGGFVVIEGKADESQVWPTL